MQRSIPTVILRIHIRTFGDKQFGDFLGCRIMQRSPSILILRINIRTV